MATNGQINRVPHLVNGIIIVQLEDIYSNIGDTCGITRLVLPAPPNAKTGSLRKLVKNGVISRAKVRVNSTSTTSGGSVYITRTVYMSTAQAPLVGALVGQKLGSLQTIRSAYFPQHITLG